MSCVAWGSRVSVGKALFLQLLTLSGALLATSTAFGQANRDQEALAFVRQKLTSAVHVQDLGDSKRQTGVIAVDIPLAGGGLWVFKDQRSLVGGNSRNITQAEVLIDPDNIQSIGPDTHAKHWVQIICKSGVRCIRATIVSAQVVYSSGETSDLGKAGSVEVFQRDSYPTASDEDAVRVGNALNHLLASHKVRNKKSF